MSNKRPPSNVIPACIPFRLDQLEWLRQQRERSGIPASVFIRELLDKAMKESEQSKES